MLFSIWNIHTIFPRLRASLSINLAKNNFPHSYRKSIHVKAACSVHFRCVETFCYARQIKTGRLRSITCTHRKPSINFLNTQLNANHFLFPPACIFTSVTLIWWCAMLHYMSLFLAIFQLATIQTYKASVGCRGAFSVLQKSVWRSIMWHWLVTILMTAALNWLQMTNTGHEGLFFATSGCCLCTLTEPKPIQGGVPLCLEHKILETLGGKGQQSKWLSRLSTVS